MLNHDGKLIEKEAAEQYGYNLRDKSHSLQLDEEVARQLGFKCRDCGSKSTVYAISKPLKVFPEGAYCYKCLLKRCKLSRLIPFPIDEELLNNLKRGMGVEITQPPVYFRPK